MSRPTIAMQNARIRELDAIRCARPLTDAEAREADHLAACAYHRIYRAQRAERWGHPTARARARQAPDREAISQGQMR
ncbi:hypothetical protein GRI97_17580 [Altererythrobacter xixiisoli]|uniref:Uncharacterized protein n=1 Tax=Croceibacterium xixiisoli TaxID=1476466 RepID=A0A6I4U2E1_9SPHN|nr:hypothetical protein [Croceibacterium xixiisoli]MXP00804.1 hypothetical protein [Croceibacterium xixiisoli]